MTTDKVVPRLMEETKFMMMTAMWMDLDQSFTDIKLPILLRTVMDTSIMRCSHTAITLVTVQDSQKRLATTSSSRQVTGGTVTTK